jgi:hypothetical protein
MSRVKQSKAPAKNAPLSGTRETKKPSPIKGGKKNEVGNTNSFSTSIIVMHPHI